MSINIKDELHRSSGLVGPTCSRIWKASVIMTFVGRSRPQAPTCWGWRSIWPAWSTAISEIASVVPLGNVIGPVFSGQL